MNHSCIASLRVIHASKERETLHNIPDLAISMACSHLCVLFSSCVYIHTAHTQPTSLYGALVAETYAVITALMLAGRAAVPDPHVTPARKRVWYGSRERQYGSREGRFAFSTLRFAFRVLRFVFCALRFIFTFCA